MGDWEWVIFITVQLAGVLPRILTITNDYHDEDDDIVMFTMIMTIDNHLLCDIGDYKIGASKTNTGIFLDVPAKAKY